MHTNDFDWQRFLDQHHIDYVTTGPNVAVGNIAISCPFCQDDPSHHLSISLRGRGWRCWRRPDHYGKQAPRLIQALLKCSWEHAVQLTGRTVSAGPDWHSRVHELMSDAPPMTVTPTLELPAEFRSLDGKPTVVTRPYISYLGSRGYNPSLELTRRYQMYMATRGPWRGRIIFAVYYGGKLVSWTGRAIYRRQEPRYLALTTNEDRARRLGLKPAVGPLPNYLLWYDRLMKTDADTICICEGPFDALKVRVLGRDHGITATCLFTSAPSAAQVDCLHELLPRFRRRISLLDAGTLPAAIRMSGNLYGLNMEIVSLPNGLKDPGDLRDTRQLTNLLATSNGAR